MKTQEKEKMTHLLILVVYTIFTVALGGEAYLMEWEVGPVLLLFIGLAVSWTFYISEKVSTDMQIWLNFILTMLAIFYYGSHETSMYDLASFMIMIIILYSVTEKHSIIWLCVATYYFTMLYDFMFVKESLILDELTVSRTILHFVLVFVAGLLSKMAIQKNKRERKDMNKIIDELEETNRRTEDFLTNVSHELRTPINVVTGITSVMLKKEDDSDKRKDIISVQKAGHRLFEQIEDILDYSEIDTGRIIISNDSYMISSVINDIITGNQLTERKNDIELIFDVAPTVPAVLSGDARKIKKILVHLIDNAYKFTKEGGIYVRIYTLQKNYGVNLCINVCDTGIGMPEEELGKIMGHFYQSNGGRNRKAGGLGLGLSIVYGLVSAMEGFIQIESEEEHGTSVAISIPQNVVDDTPGIAIDNPDSICVGCFIMPEKYKVPKVRDFYNEAITHVSKGVNTDIHRVSGIDELEILLSGYKLTHLFMGVEEYNTYKNRLMEIENEVSIVVMADDNFELPLNSPVSYFRKPFYALPLVQKINADKNGEEIIIEKFMKCPDVRVLVVDDEPMNLMVAQGIFMQYQMNVTTAESGKKAIELCKSNEYDLIFLDHMMPEMDGVETLAKIRKLCSETGKIFTIIAFTANAVSGAREMFLNAGFDEFISKPVDISELERLLRKLLPNGAIIYGSRKDNTDIKTEIKTEIKTDTKTEIKNDIEVNITDVIVSKQDYIIKSLNEAGFNTKDALNFSGGDKEFYFRVLEKYIQSFTENEQEINQFYQNKDLKNYRIKVHALKSSSKLAGAFELSEMARKLEEASDKNDLDYILANHDNMISKYQEVTSVIAELIKTEDDDASETEKIEITKEKILFKLNELYQAIKKYDIDLSERIFDEIKDTSFMGISVGEKLKDVNSMVEDFEFDTAGNMLESIIDEFERRE